MPQTGHLFFEDHGSGPPLLLLHGHTLDGRMWAEILPHLTPHFRVIVPDLPGHGRSGISPHEGGFAADIAAVLDHLSIDRAGICGLSMGGAAAISFALHYPTRTTLLALVDTALFGYRFEDWSGPRPYVQMARTEGLAAALEAWLADPVFAPATASPAAAQIREIIHQFPGRPWLEATAPAFPSGPPEADRIGEIAVPTLILSGALDLPDFHRIADRLERAIPGAERRVFEGVGHLLPLEWPEEFARTLRSFCQQALT